MDILVLAGGLGTRIRPALGDLPKILAPIAGRPYLAHLLDWLQTFGARRVVLSLGHLAQKVVAYLNSQAPTPIEIATVVEPAPLGTAGAIRFARHELRTDPVLVLNGDSFAEADLCAFVEDYRSAGALCSILCAEVDDAGRYGRVEIDRRSCIRKFIEKDAEFRGRALVNAGIYLLSATVLDNITASHAVSLERDVFERFPAGSIRAYAGRFRFIDIGTPYSLARAADLFLRPSMI
jgi:mannose-1-phosphate guanylyltransferase